jgi:hypothetical protein
MSDLRSDISGLGRICLVWGLDMFGHQKLRAVEKLIESQDDATRSR